MLKDVLKAVLRVFAGTIFILALAATIGIPAGKRGPAAAQPGDEPRGWTFRALRGTISHPRMYPDGRRPLLQGEENLDLGRTSANVGADGPNRRSRRTRDPAPRQRVAFPLQATGPATSVDGFPSSIPCPPLGRRCSCLRFGPHRNDAPRKTRGQDGFAAPFLSDSFIPDCMPVYPGAPSVPRFCYSTR